MQPRRYAFDFGLVSAVSMRADRLLLFFFDFSFFLFYIFVSFAAVVTVYGEEMAEDWQ